MQNCAFTFCFLVHHFNCITKIILFVFSGAHWDCSVVEGVCYSHINKYLPYDSARHKCERQRGALLANPKSPEDLQKVSDWARKLYSINI